MSSATVLQTLGHRDQVLARASAFPHRLARAWRGLRLGRSRASLLALTIANAAAQSR